ncbi:MAG: DNA (cytosine-5-)-methyltransferase [Bacteroidales bacterium]|nr:DNA (cytosine-5-)-methyltransferase [Bacteroidales bacterium]
MRVLSLFDGISCGHVALDRAGIPVEVYYASEIDKYAIQITQKNYPNTIQLGDVTKIDFTQFIGKVDLIMGGSPCQDLSIAGKRAGLQGERSGLFYKFVEAIEVIKPKYFLLENNVGMPQEAYEEISRLMGCYPIEINSALVSAQTRKRYYWTNIGHKQYNLFGFPTVDIPQPENKGILLKDILESGIAPDDKSRCIQSSIGRTTEREYFKKNQGQMVAEPLKIPEATSKGYAEIQQGECMDLTHLSSKTRRGRAMKEKCNCLQTQSEFYQYLEPIRIGHFNKGEQRQRIYSSNGKSIACASGEGGGTQIWTEIPLEPVRLPEYEKSKGQANRVYSVHNKSVTLLANAGGGGAKTGLYKIDLSDGEYLIRKLTPLECERLQTLPDNYTEFGLNDEYIKTLAKKSEIKSKKEIDLKERYVKISNTQRYKAIGNGWTVDVIAHIFSFIGDKND